MTPASDLNTTLAASTVGASTTTLPTPYPFVALIGQAPLQQALLLLAVDAGLGGLLIAGPRGTAKSTSARALAALLAPAPFITLPLGASESQLIGTLDLDAVLREGAARFAPGLLAKAEGGVLYVDEVNLLPDALADALLDVAASGVNRVERDGVSHVHAARFVLVGTMNEEEGELRPQLSDRFGLSVVLENYADIAQREAIVRARLAFDLDAVSFTAQHAAATLDLRARIDAARRKLADLSFSDAVHRRVSEWCLAAAVDGVRADLVMLKAARAQAALDGVDAIDVAHVDRVADLVLAHRRQAPGRPPATSDSGATDHGDDDADDGKGDRSDRSDRDRGDAGDRSDVGDGGGRGGHRKEVGEGRKAGAESGASAETVVGDIGREAEPVRKGHDGHKAHDGARTARPDGNPHADWGYLAPEATTIAAIKPLRPYDPKKA